MIEASKGLGVDRHLLGLRLLSLEEEQKTAGAIPTPDIFKDPSFTASCYWRISTSNLSNERFDGWGWGEVVPDGVGKH